MKITPLKELIQRYPGLLIIEAEIQNAADCLISCYLKKGKVLVCGNGGSASDSGHIVAELMKNFEHIRPVEDSFRKQLTASGGERGTYLAGKLQQGLPAISLAAHDALITAVSNDIDPDLIFAQQTAAYGNKGDVLIAISTSGNSQNIIDAIITAKAKGMVTIGMTGKTGGRMKSVCDILIKVPETRTSFVQEFHFPVYHALCLMVENYFFDNK